MELIAFAALVSIGLLLPTFLFIRNRIALASLCMIGGSALSATLALLSADAGSVLFLSFFGIFVMAPLGLLVLMVAAIRGVGRLRRVQS